MLCSLLACEGGWPPNSSFEHQGAATPGVGDGAPRVSPTEAAGEPRTPYRERVAHDYVGSRTCAACHSDAYEWWKGTRHGRAFETLVTRGKQRDEECLGCHVTGYEDLSTELRADIEYLKGVGCESCHGPGVEHVQNPRDPEQRVHRAVPERICVTCHDGQFGDRPFEYLPRREELLVRSHGRAAPKPRLARDADTK